MSPRPTNAGCLRRAHRTFCLVWATICLLVTGATAEAETYYVHATNGDDRNAGTRAGAPWQTLGRVNAQRLQPGDRVLRFNGCPVSTAELLLRMRLFTPGNHLE